MRRGIRKEAELSKERRAELELSIARMEATKDLFYAGAVHCGSHAFVEFTGVLHQYIQSCREALDHDIDFAFANKHTGASLPMPSHAARYLGEKIGCIWAGSLKDPKKFEEFKHGVFET